MKLLFKGIIGLSLLAGSTMPVYADSHGPCDEGNKSQVKLDHCFVNAEKDTNTTLKTVFGKVLVAAKELDDVTAPRRDVVPALVTGQYVWEQYRDKHCEFVGTTWGGGSGTGIAVTKCRINLTRARIEELSRIEM